jgi:hypothetical protein
MENIKVRSIEQDDLTTVYHWICSLNSMVLDIALLKNIFLSNLSWRNSGILCSTRPQEKGRREKTNT